jgi:hypothetical protein
VEAPFAIDGPPQRPASLGPTDPNMPRCCRLARDFGSDGRGASPWRCDTLAPRVRHVGFPDAAHSVAIAEARLGSRHHRGHPPRERRVRQRHPDSLASTRHPTAGNGCPDDRRGDDGQLERAHGCVQRRPAKHVALCHRSQRDAGAADPRPEPRAHALTAPVGHPAAIGNATAVDDPATVGNAAAILDAAAIGNAAAILDAAAIGNARSAKRPGSTRCTNGPCGGPDVRHGRTCG